VELKLRQEIQQFDTKLGVDLLPKADSTCNEQWIMYLKRMLDEHIYTDVTINLFHQTKLSQPSIFFPRFLLASQSAYFYSAFCTELRESSTSSVHLPS
jgi:hypothetical protein